MKVTLRPPRTPSSFSDSICHKLNVYSIAATAAGVTLLAAQPSEAKIIYKSTHKVIGANGFYGLDLNHDGNVDFIIQEDGAPFSSSGSNALGVKEAYRNGVVGTNKLASALKQGTAIGPKQNFLATSDAFGEVMFAAACSADGGCSTVGNWDGVSNRYLGLKFKIAGKTHYGWARLNVSVQAGHNIVATLTGYAYETVPQKAISAGKTVESEKFNPESVDEQRSDLTLHERSQSSQQTLGRLALGSLGPRRRP